MLPTEKTQLPALFGPGCYIQYCIRLSLKDTKWTIPSSFVRYLIDTLGIPSPVQSVIQPAIWPVFTICRPWLSPDVTCWSHRTPR